MKKFFSRWEDFILELLSKGGGIIKYIKIKEMAAAEKSFDFRISADISYDQKNEEFVLDGFWHFDQLTLRDPDRFKHLEAKNHREAALALLRLVANELNTRTNDRRKETEKLGKKRASIKV